MKLPQIYILELTRRCNHRCLYCYTVWGEPTLGYAPNGSSAGEMNTAETLALIDKLCNEAHPISIALSGGEPFMRVDLPDILNHIRQKDIVPVIITNGSMLTKERVTATMGDGSYQITLLSHKPVTHDHLAGRSGTWNAVIDGYLNVQRAGGNITSVFIATRENSPDLATTAQLAIALGANGIMYNRINLAAHNVRFASQLLPTRAMIQDNLETLERIAVDYKIPVVVSVPIEPCVIDVRPYTHLHFGWCPLAGEESYLTVDPVGNVRICNHSPMILGNLRTQSLAEIFFNNPYIENFRSTWPAECASCRPELKEMCRGGCRAAAEQCYGTLARVDPFVTLAH